MAEALAESLRSLLELCGAVERDRTHNRLHGKDTGALFRRISSLAKMLGGKKPSLEKVSQAAAARPPTILEHRASVPGLARVQHESQGSMGSGYSSPASSLDSTDDLLERHRSIFGSDPDITTEPAASTPPARDRSRPTRPADDARSPLRVAGRRSHHGSPRPSPIAASARDQAEQLSVHNATLPRRADVRQKALRCWQAIRSVVLVGTHSKGLPAASDSPQKQLARQLSSLSAADQA